MKRRKKQRKIKWGFRPSPSVKDLIMRHMSKGKRKPKPDIDKIARAIRALKLRTKPAKTYKYNPHLKP